MRNATFTYYLTLISKSSLSHVPDLSSTYYSLRFNTVFNCLCLSCISNALQTFLFPNIILRVPASHLG